MEAIGGQLCGVTGGAAQVRQPRVWSLQACHNVRVSASSGGFILYLEFTTIKVGAAVEVFLCAAAHQHLCAAINEATHTSLCT